jgi:DinB superfamily
MKALQARLQSIETKRILLQQRVSGLEPHVMTARPRPDKWSILEIVEHLVLSERVVFGPADALEQRTPRERSLRNRALYWMVMFILRFDIPVKVPSAALLPEGTRSVGSLWAQWEASHAALRRWVEASDTRVRRHALFSHPVAGPMTMADTLRMLDVHLDRHIRQVEALVGSRGRW